MLELAEIEPLTDLPPGGLTALRRASELRAYPSGHVICRKGDEDRAFYVVAYGGVSIHSGDWAGFGPPSAYLGPGQIFGELPLLSSLPTAATVVAERDTVVHVLPKAAVLDLFASYPALHQALIQMIGRGIPQPMQAVRGPSCAFVLTTSTAEAIRPFIDGLMRAVNHYAPGSLFVNAVRRGDGSEVVSHELLPALPALPGLLRQTVAEPRWRGCVAASSDWLSELVTSWQGTRETGRILLLVLHPSQARSLTRLMQRGDFVLAEENAVEQTHLEVLASGSGLADLRFFCLPGDGATRRWNRGDWRFRVTAQELDRPATRWANRDWAPSTAPNLDWIARWITGREIGIALGAGTAAGFAHLGVIEVLEEAGVTLDYLCGSSIGGAAALLYGRFARCDQVTGMACGLVGSNDRLVDVSWLPRSSVLSGKKHHAAALRLFGDAQIADFVKPAAAVAADLVRGERFVLERGSAATAARATTAVPGVFPPVSSGGRLLVDGGLLSRVPVDLLFRRRCGLKLAVSVLPTLARAAASDTDLHVRELRRRFQRLLGFRSVVARSWQVLGTWQTAMEAQGADILLEPRVPQSSSFDFGACEAMIAAGRVTAEQRLDTIRSSVATLLKPGPVKPDADRRVMPMATHEHRAMHRR